MAFEQFDTFAFRFTTEDGKPPIIYLLRKDFDTPQDCFFEGKVPHWDDPLTKHMTWGNVAGPINLKLAQEEYAYYVGLVEIANKVGLPGHFAMQKAKEHN